MQSGKSMPGYTGYKPNPEGSNIGGPAPQREGGAHVPGYGGYVPGVKSENVFGQSYGKTSGAANNGTITRGFDQPTTEKYTSINQGTYQDQRQLYQSMRNPEPQPRKVTVDDIPRHVQAKFFGIPDYDNDKYTQYQKLQEAAMSFYGDGSKLQEVYGNKGEQFDDAAAKFYGSPEKTQIGVNRNQVSMTYDEARRVAYSGTQ